MRSRYGRKPSGSVRQFAGGATFAGTIGTVFSAAATGIAVISNVAFNTSAGSVRFALASLAVSTAVMIGGAVARRCTREGDSGFTPVLAGMAVSGAVIVHGASALSTHWDRQQQPPAAQAPAMVAPTQAPAPGK